MKRTLLLPALLFALLTTNQTTATHIVGGEMYYKFLGNNDYEISCTIYRDCYNGVPLYDNPASFGFFNSANVLVYSALIPFVDLDTLPPTINNPCFIPPTDVCYETTTYTFIQNLPPIAGGYKIVYQRCCRNVTIINIIDPNATGGTYIAFLPGPEIVDTNSNPYFPELPPPFLCQDAPFTFDHSALDYDGDSLVYELFTPLHGASTGNPMPQPPLPPPYTPINWQTPYSEADMLGGVPLAIDPQTGELTCTPNTLGQFVIGVRCIEFRNGDTISMTQRDYQFNVVECENLVVASIYSPIIECGSFTANFTNNSFGATYYFWDFGDTTITTDTSSQAQPSWAYPDTGTYLVMLIAYSDIDSLCNDTIWGIVHINPPFTAHFTYEVNPCTGEVTFADSSYSVTGNPNEWFWDFGDNTTDTLENPSHTYASWGTYNVTLYVMNSDSCSDTIVIPVMVPPQTGSTNVDLTICIGESAQLTATGGIIYHWTPEETLNNPNISNPIATPTETTTYNVEITMIYGSGDTCIENHSVTVFVISGANLPLDATADQYSIDRGSSTGLHAVPNNYNSYSWEPPETLDNPNSANPIASPTTTTTYVVTIIDSMGCERKDSVTITINPLDCGESDLFIPSAFTPNGDDQNDILKVRSPNITELYLAIYDRWGEKVFETTDPNIGWDGTYKGRKVDPGVFVYYLDATCDDNARITQKGNVTVIR